ncbi:transposase [Schinkia azotoformans MEV2011]|uniref:Transposase n=1 Tax=Schinkia azotoformans MEV2011 TaxID=1348973 RepID=A0A072NYZ6_SCHAZ|nr:transposase [Schinkia azotoformans MEV2011]
MDGYRKNSHAVHDIKYHVIWVTKYRYKILRGPIAIRARELIRQGCEARGIIILQGSVGKDHIHLLLSCPPSLAPSKILQYLKGRSSRLLQDEFLELKRDIGVSIYGQEDTFVQLLVQ